MTNPVYCLHCGGELVFNVGPSVTRSILGEPIVELGVSCVECKATYTLGLVSPKECVQPERKKG